MERGYIHIYTGDGKGKSTAAFGLALRALCAGKNVYIGQFIKSLAYSENRVVSLLETADSSFGKLTIDLLGRGGFITHNPEQEDMRLAHEGLARCGAILRDGFYDVVILDEICVALFFHLISVDEVLEFINARASHVEVVLTGRKAPQRLIDIADLVTNMCEVKHYYNEGVLSRNGIDH